MNRKIDKEKLIKKCSEIFSKIEKNIDVIAKCFDEIEDVTEKGALLTYIILTLMSRSKIPTYALLGLLEVTKAIILEKTTSNISSAYNYYV